MANKEKKAPGIYKDYDIRWLKGIGAEHPAFSLVAEYEDKYGPIEEIEEFEFAPAPKKAKKEDKK